MSLATRSLHAQTERQFQTTDGTHSGGCEPTVAPSVAEGSGFDQGAAYEAVNRPNRLSARAPPLHPGACGGLSPAAGHARSRLRRALFCSRSTEVHKRKLKPQEQEKETQPPERGGKETQHDLHSHQHCVLGDFSRKRKTTRPPQLDRSIRTPGWGGVGGVTA